MSIDHLLLFTRFPQPGTTKTRLIPLLGPHGAAELQRMMTEIISGKVRKFSATHSINVDVRFDGGDVGQMKKWLGNDFGYHHQGRGHIGCRMYTAFRDAFKTGADAVVLIGSDIPGISTLILQNAFTALTHSRMVIGPARDGGYYLIGLRSGVFHRIGHQLFDGYRWGSDSVFSKTVATAGEKGIDCITLEKLADIDRPEDLPIWHKELARKQTAIKSFS